MGSTHSSWKQNKSKSPGRSPLGMGSQSPRKSGASASSLSSIANQSRSPAIKRNSILSSPLPTIHQKVKKLTDVKKLSPRAPARKVSPTMPTVKKLKQMGGSDNKPAFIPQPLHNGSTATLNKPESRDVLHSQTEPINIAELGLHELLPRNNSSYLVSEGKEEAAALRSVQEIDELNLIDKSQNPDDASSARASP